MKSEKIFLLLVVIGALVYGVWGKDIKNVMIAAPVAIGIGVYVYHRNNKKKAGETPAKEVSK